MKKTALITGVSGQDGAYLAELLLKKDYKVYGMIRSSTRYPFRNLDYLGVTDQIDYITADITDGTSLINAVRRIRPNEIYNLAAQSFVGISWDQPIVGCETNALGVLRLLEAIKHFTPMTRFYQASTSEMFGNSNRAGLQSENTPFHPCSPYATAKLYAYWITNNYRQSYGMFCVSGILFNHESPIRGEEFVTRKISLNVAKIKLGMAERFGLANLDSKRDWGFAGDYVEAMYLMLQHKEPDNYIISTGQTHSIHDFLDVAFRHVGIKNWKKHIYIDPAFKRPVEVLALHGKSAKAQQKLKWKPKVKFEQLVCMMVDADVKRLHEGKIEP